MGTCYKGDSKYYRSIGQNVLITASAYQYSNGHFGVNSPTTGNRTRNISSSDPLATARDFYNKIAYGGTESIMNGGSLRITHMADGSVISMRTISHSDGTPAVQINITNSTHSGGVKDQKIHFIKEDK